MMSSARVLALLALAAPLAAALALTAGDTGHKWPEGSAMHTMQLEKERLDSGRASLDQAHADLLGALGGKDADNPSALARAVASQHETWLAYSHADCALAGTLTGAGSSWPIVHGLSCEAEVVEQRLEVVRGATACLQKLGADTPDYEQFECLQGLVAWSMQPD